MSIRPQWCEKIFNGSKTIEVRKSRPSIPTPFKVYVYQTKRRGKSIVSEVLNSVYGGGKVIGSFVCNKIEKIEFIAQCSSILAERWTFNRIAKQACLTPPEMSVYLSGNNGYGWHITEPKLFDKPRAITEFAIFGKCADECSEYDFCAREIAEDRMTCKYFKRTFLTRPPQSWCYVEVENDT